MSDQEDQHEGSTRRVSRSSLGSIWPKGDHFAQAITTSGEKLFVGAVANDQTAIEALITEAAEYGRVALEGAGDIVERTVEGRRNAMLVCLRHEGHW